VNKVRAWQYVFGGDTHYNHLRQVSPLSCPLGKGFEAFSFIIVGPSMAIDWWLDI